MKGKITISLLVTFLMIFTTVFVFGESTQQKINDNNEKVDQLETEMSSIQGEINETQAEINTASEKVATLQKKVEANQKALEKQKKELEEGQKELNDRLRNMYKNGSIGFVDVILSSSDVEELISNFEIVKRIYSSDSEMVADLQTKYDAIETKQKTLTAQKAQLEEEVDSLVSKQAKLNKELQSASSTKYQVQKDTATMEANLSAAAYRDSGTVSSGEYTGSTSSGAFAWPVPGYYTITSGYGYRNGPIYGYEKHRGIDISAPTGTPVVAAANGKVVLAGWNSSFGYQVIISHGNGLYTQYAHNSSLVVHSGQTVKKGQTISRVGSTGDSTGPHCHFEVRTSPAWGTDVNPLSYL